MTKETIKKKAVILDGKKISQDIKREIFEAVEGIKQAGRKVPHLAAVLVGSDGASMTYVNSKVRDCEEVGFRSTKISFHETVSEEELLSKIDEINQDDDIDGLIVQLPLPKHISKKKVTERIAPEKDVDGFTAINYGRMASNLPSFISATPFGIMELLKRYNITTRGKHVVVVGRSHIVGAPTSILMARPGDATVTLCHRFTSDLEDHVRRADILVVAVGKPGMIKSDMIKPGAVIVDVGITRVEDASRKSGYSLKGDVDFDDVIEKCSYITPVPGGVGPMTRAALLLNTLKAARVSFE